jgi:hypothetical protein
MRNMKGAMKKSDKKKKKNRKSTYKDKNGTYE